jgi:hypothetical protein
MGKLSQQEDDWQRRATDAAISAAKHVVFAGEINGRAMISSLSDIEWGWIVAGILFAWIQTKAEQATTQGIGYDMAILKHAGRDPEPWEAGAVSIALPVLGALEGLDWNKPLGEWTKEQIAAFAWDSYRTINAALAARDAGGTDHVIKFNKEQCEREVSAANGGALLARQEEMVPPWV